MSSSTTTDSNKRMRANEWQSRPTQTKPAKKSVSFSEYSSFILILTNGKPDASGSDSKKLHYSNSEIRRMKDRTLLIVRTMNQLMQIGAQDDPGVVEELRATQGLEKLLSPAMMTASLRERRAHMTAVLNEQRSHGNRDRFHSDVVAHRLAELSALHSQQAVARAKALGMKHFYERETD